MAAVQDRTHAVDGLNDPQQGACSGPQAVVQYRDHLFGGQVRAGTVTVGMARLAMVATPS